MDTLGLFVVCALLLAGCAGYAGVDSRIRRTDRRIARVEQKLDLLLDHFALTRTEPALEQVTALARDGRRIQAIKVYREITGADLKEAKEAVEQMAEST